MIARAVLRELNEARRDRYTSMFRGIIRSAKEISALLTETGMWDNSLAEGSHIDTIVQWGETGNRSFIHVLDGLMEFGKDDRVVYGIKNFIAKMYVYMIQDIRSIANEMVSWNDEENAPAIAKFSDAIQVAEGVANDWVRKRSGYDGLEDFKSNGMGSLQELKHFLSLPIPEIQETVLVRQKLSDLLITFSALEQKWKESTKNFIPDYEDSSEEVLVSFDNGFRWVNLNRNGCQREAKAMGHCSTGAHPGDINFSLRERVTTRGVSGWKSHLTFIWNQHTGFLNEMKGRNNEKPEPKYYGYIERLLRHPRVLGIVHQHSGYRPNNDFDIYNLPEQVRSQLFEEKPCLFTPHDIYVSRGACEELVRSINAVIVAKRKINSPKESYRLVGGDVLYVAEKYTGKISNYVVRKIGRKQGLRLYDSGYTGVPLIFTYGVFAKVLSDIHKRKGGGLNLNPVLDLGQYEEGASLRVSIRIAHYIEDLMNNSLVNSLERDYPKDAAMMRDVARIFFEAMEEYAIKHDDSRETNLTAVLNHREGMKEIEDTFGTSSRFVTIGDDYYYKLDLKKLEESKVIPPWMMEDPFLGGAISMFRYDLGDAVSIKAGFFDGADFCRIFEGRLRDAGLHREGTE